LIEIEKRCVFLLVYNDLEALLQMIQIQARGWPGKKGPPSRQPKRRPPISQQRPLTINQTSSSTLLVSLAASRTLFSLLLSFDHYKIIFSVCIFNFYHHHFLCFLNSLIASFSFTNYAGDETFFVVVVVV
jgi:hypothetical protein